VFRLWHVSAPSVKLENPRLLRDESEISCLALAPDGRMLATSNRDGTVVQWDVTTGQEKARWAKAHDKEIRALTFAPGGKTLATGGDYGKVKLWQVQSGEWLLTMYEERYKINGIDFDHDGRTLAVAA
jgi:WD40 repeat protein